MPVHVEKRSHKNASIKCSLKNVHVRGLAPSKHAWWQLMVKTSRFCRHQIQSSHSVCALSCERGLSQNSQIPRFRWCHSLPKMATQHRRRTTLLEQNYRQESEVLIFSFYDRRKLRKVDQLCQERYFPRMSCGKLFRSCPLCPAPSPPMSGAVFIFETNRDRACTIREIKIKTSKGILSRKHFRMRSNGTVKNWW